MIKDSQTITLSKEQYLTIMKLSWLGNWVANAHRDGSPENPYLQEFEDIHSYILSFAKQFGYGQYIDDSSISNGRVYETLKFDEDFDLYGLTQEYDDSMFWEELTNRMAERDVDQNTNRAERRKAKPEDRFDKLYHYLDIWEQEFNANGLKNLTLQKPPDI